MPAYEFACAGCGPFEVVRPMAAAAEPVRCPSCGGDARRVFSAPGVPLLEAPMRRARDLEERSAHEPQVVASKSGRPLPHHHHSPAPPWALSH
jgi:putative FmdB family regulatory protein